MPARRSRKPYQILEDTFGGGSHILHESDSEPVATVPARWSLLADVGPARIDAETFDITHCAIRHPPFAAYQDRGTRGRNENDDQDSPANFLSGTKHHAARADAYSPPRHLSGGALRPELEPIPSTCKHFSHSLWLTAGDDVARRQIGKAGKYCSQIVADTQKRLKGCIMRAKDYTRKAS